MTALTCAGTPTTTGSTPATRPPTARRVVYHLAGDIWLLDSLDADAQPRKLDLQLGAPPAARAPKLITAEDNLGDLDCDRTGQASVVTVRGTVHWLTHADGPARALLVDPAARARLPRVLGKTGTVAWVTDAEGPDAIQIAEVEPEQAGPARTIASGAVGDVLSLEASPDGSQARRRRRRRPAAARRRRVGRGHRAGQQ